MDTLSRTLQPTRRVLGDVDPAQPLDTTHPLLDGVQGFWLPLPHLTGSSRLYDLSGRGRNGSVSSALSADAWGATPEWEYSAVRFDGTSGQKINQPSMPTTGPYTIITWVVLPDLNNDYAAWDWGVPDTGELHLLWMDVGDSRGWRFLDSTIGSTSSTNGGAKAGVVQMVTVAYDESEYRLYTDDTLTGSFAGSRSDRDTFRWGQQNDTAKTLNGHLCGGVFLDRGIELAEVQRWKEESRRGFTDLLRRRDSVGLLGGGGAPTTDTVSFDTATALADGFEPAVTATANTLNLGTAQAAAQGFSAGVTATQNTVSVGTAQATAQGFAPTITTGSNTIAVTTGQAAAQGFDPTISEGAAGDTLVADLGTAQTIGFDPSITTTSATVTLGLGEAGATGFAPEVLADPSEINTGQGQAAATGFDPTVTTSARTVAPQLGTAQADGFEPAVVDGTVGVATTMEIEARPLYEIDVEAKPLYRIQLFVKEQLP